MIPCSLRIQEILEWVNGDVIADIGCDHAYVSVNAILNRQSKKAYACDVAKGPLENAKKTILENHVENKVTCCLMNGIQGLSQDVNQIIITGMGGKLIIDILEHGHIYTGLRFLLSCHKDSFALREYLMQHNIHILREKVIFDKDHYYPVMDCVVKDTSQVLTKAQLMYGYHVLENAIYDAYLDSELCKYQNLLEKVHKQEFFEQIEYIKEIRNQRIS